MIWVARFYEALMQVLLNAKTSAVNFDDEVADHLNVRIAEHDYSDRNGIPRFRRSLHVVLPDQPGAR